MRLLLPLTIYYPVASVDLLYCLISFFALSLSQPSPDLTVVQRQKKLGISNSAQLKSVGVGEDVAYTRDFEEIFLADSEIRTTSQEHRAASLLRRSLEIERKFSHTVVELRGENVSAISICGTVLAAVSRSSIVLVNISDSMTPITKTATVFSKLAEVMLPEVFKTAVIVYFKLLNQSTVFLCGYNICR